MKNKSSQVSIELTLAFIVVFMLFIASAKIFSWFCNSLAERQQAFEESRVIRGSHQVQPGDVKDLDYQPSPLNLVR